MLSSATQSYIISNLNGGMVETHILNCSIMIIVNTSIRILKKFMQIHRYFSNDDKRRLIILEEKLLSVRFLQLAVNMFRLKNILFIPLPWRWCFLPSRKTSAPLVPNFTKTISKRSKQMKFIPAGTECVWALALYFVENIWLNPGSYIADSRCLKYSRLQGIHDHHSTFDWRQIESFFDFFEGS